MFLGIHFLCYRQVYRGTDFMSNTPSLLQERIIEGLTLLGIHLLCYRYRYRVFRNTPSSLQVKI